MFQCSVGQLTCLKTLACNYIPASTNNAFRQSVRWHRKPRWVPMAKSKLYRIPVRPVIAKEERDELFKLHNIYKTQLRAVQFFLRNELVTEENSLFNVDSEQSKTEEAVDFERCMAENDSWNAEVAKGREERRKIQRKEREETVLRLMDQREKTYRRHLEEAEEKVRLLKEQAKSFITLETLDAALEAAVNNPVDFNFALDLEGNIYPGREGKTKATEGDGEKLEKITNTH